MSYQALTIAKYFLSLPDKDSGELISNLKLQKLLYYAQGFHVGLYGVGSPLFPDKIFAWKHGPVVRTVYNHFANYQARALPFTESPKGIDSRTLRLLQEIHRVFGRYSAWALREMTHREDPWIKNYDPDEKNVEISLSDLRAYFVKYVKKQGKK